MTMHSGNRLLHESSPYLLQHAHNPVDWYPWGEQALEKAKTEDKLILISIGYSACHWCHVMEKESFENEAVAQLMNEHFVNIKIDREERPDLDHIYMDAVQLMTGSGGWPLNVFLTPSAKPFYGGTYFPPVRAYNRASWSEVLTRISTAWKTRKQEIIEQSESLTDHLAKNSAFNRTTEGLGEAVQFSKTQADEMFEQIMKTADTEWGGFGAAPKFPQTFTLRYLLQYHYFTGNETALKQAILSVDKMLEGGIYDQVGGGLARYSTDREWLAPHFEKMLYDNALFVILLCDIYSLTGEMAYAKAIRRTLDFILREMHHPEDGFYAAIDADSEGEEGRYYVWDKAEVDGILGDASPEFCRYFDISGNGNWEGKNILRILKKAGDFAVENGLSETDLEDRLRAGLKKLMEVRDRRVRPSLDDKILLGWNAMMITAFSKSAAVLSDEGYFKVAEENFNNILKLFRLRENEPALYHSYKGGTARYPAFLDDYACLIQACISLQEYSSQSAYLQHARQFTEHVIREFHDTESGFFYFTGKGQKDLIMRKKEVHDGATPSGNSLMAENLFYLSAIFNNAGWYAIAQDITARMAPAALRHPGSLGIWASLILQQAYGVVEIVLTGQDFQVELREILRRYLPAIVLQSASSTQEDFCLFEGKDFTGKASIYWCENNSCQAPVGTPTELFAMDRRLTFR